MNEKCGGGAPLAIRAAHPVNQRLCLTNQRLRGTKQDESVSAPEESALAPDESVKSVRCYSSKN